MNYITQHRQQVLWDLLVVKSPEKQPCDHFSQCDIDFIKSYKTGMRDDEKLCFLGVAGDWHFIHQGIGYFIKILIA